MKRSMTRSKRSARGAAMVEAIVVMCVMLVFLGMNTWAYRAYGGKIDQMSSTRRDALYYASHSCEKRLDIDPDDYTVPALRGNDASGGSSMTLRGIIAAFKGNGFDFFGTARSKKGTVVVAGTALTKAGALGTEKTPLAANLKTASAVSCNEKRLGEGVLTLVKLGWGFLTGMAK